MNKISYQVLADAVDFYQKHGFSYIEVPWWVSEDAMAATRPENVEAEAFHLSAKNKTLVASGEQSFLYLAMKGLISSDASFCTVTPCFREESQGVLHRKAFMKCELFHLCVNRDPMRMLERTLLVAREFFSEQLGIELPRDYSGLIKSKSWDIVISMPNGDIELGSYGIREYKGLTWVYGTGVAEPRFSSTKARYLKG